MHRFSAFRIIRWTLGLALTAVAVSCTVSTKDLTFDDDLFAALGGGTGSGGSGSAAGGSGSGGSTNLGGLGGDGASSGGGPGAGGQLGAGGSPATGGAGNQVCAQDALQCDGKQVQLCSGDAWIAVGGPCPFACVEGECTGVCEPETDECLSSIQTQHCDSAGQWDDSFCQFACVGGICDGVCRPGDRECAGGDRTLCGDDGQWVTQETCPGDCDSGVCVGACASGTHQCAGDATSPVEVTCDGTSWETSPETPCEFICDETTGQCGGECKPFTSACHDSTSVQTCDSAGTYSDATACPFVCDSSVPGCGGVCVPGSWQCSGTAIQSCDDSGKWQTEDTCSESTPVCFVPTGEKPQCAACLPSSKRCAASSNSTETCGSNGQWGDTPKECPLKGTLLTLCWDGACRLPDDVCPTLTCIGKNCPSGCIDPQTAWTCGKGGPVTGSCETRTSCSEGVCN